MRLFIAINLSPEMKEALVNVQNAMYEQGMQGNYTSEENLHLTLAFIGEFPSAEPVVDALNDVTFKPFEIALDGIGRFSDLWWAGIQDSVPLTAVVRRVRRALAENEIPYDRKRFSPHITLLRKASRNAEGVQIEQASMVVHTISLMSSRRGRNGMIYKEIGTLEA